MELTTIGINFIEVYRVNHREEVSVGYVQTSGFDRKGTRKDRYLLVDEVQRDEKVVVRWYSDERDERFSAEVRRVGRTLRRRGWTELDINSLRQGGGGQEYRAYQLVVSISLYTSSADVG